MRHEKADPMNRGFQHAIKQSFLIQPVKKDTIHSLDEIPNHSDRDYWITTLTKVVSPVLEALAVNQLKQQMPVEPSTAMKSRKNFTYLETFARSLAGIAPWLELGVDESEEGQLRAKFIELSVSALRNAVNPNARDHLNFTEGNQPLVDTAFLAQALLRAPKQLWYNFDVETKQNVIAALTSTRVITPHKSNWLLFPAIIEAALLNVDESSEWQKIQYALDEHEKWYVGDGMYSDGPTFRVDYYNSFVIQPMLIDVLKTVYEKTGRMGERLQTILERAKRYAELQERMIAPDGSFPPVGRSLTYRCGAFQLLAQLSLQNGLPIKLMPNQVRSALTAVIKRTLEPPNTFDENGWLRIGLAGHQPELAEQYITTGSLYLCTVAFLPLGLPAEDLFWTLPSCNWTSKQVFEGGSLSPDKAFDGML